jgi:hypothetical protein
MSASTFSDLSTSAPPTAERSEFNYVPVPVTAPVSLIIGICSSMALLTVAGVPVALAGLLIGISAWRKIAGSDGEYGGLRIAQAGTLLCALFFVSGIGTQSYAYATEVPEGYTRLSFSQDISQKEFVVENGVPDVHPDVKALDGAPVFLKGYMYPTRQTRGLKSFIFCKDSGECCFGGQPKKTDMIYVEMEGDLTADFYSGRTAVAGTFELFPGSDGPAELRPIYGIKAVLAEPARSAL